MKDGEDWIVTLNCFGLRLLVLERVIMGCGNGLVVTESCGVDGLETTVGCKLRGLGGEVCVEDWGRGVR